MNKNIELIINKALLYDSVALNLVIHNIKPCSFITFKLKINIDKLKFKAITLPYNSNIVFFIFPHVSGYINLMMFNVTLIDKKIKQINKMQNSYKFKTAKEIINHHIYVYKNKENLKKVIGIEKHADVNLIQGIIFGFPLKNIKKFDKELRNQKFEKDRKFYYMKLSPSLIFVGYNNSKSESKKLIKKWNNAIKKIKTH